MSSDPSKTVFDTQGCPLDKGDNVISSSTTVVRWRIQEIKALLDPRLPDGSALVTLVSVVQLGVTYGQPTGMIKVATPPLESGSNGGDSEIIKP
ncbi:hypothetical protein LCGC14_3159870 [marine sediment metagenome]|uniref:Uncharacterized protein n=1 Tax=marine sediment metagenome TaxID=412755 RepID=A0A0F8WFN6_9ZZZZ